MCVITFFWLKGDIIVVGPKVQDYCDAILCKK